ncbi:MAG: hypothetical protein COS40_04260 [Deltaproteobacteria bacterium CG03_land_8_20_14_0_80_45_14]|nr:MAG: hypothetical protein COS40_04260 [Deltaproteobacteria bacterium CG03_land_8_20_14_0_80_45_14]
MGGMKFIVDRMLGRLAKELRMLGYDTVFYRGDNAYQMIKLAREEDRVILTRNTKLIPKRSEDRLVRIMEDKTPLQLKELIQKKVISLYEENLFSRCLLCNILLDKIPREEAKGKVPDFIFYQQKEFSRCPRCLRIYWRGSHQENMQKKVKELFG